MFIVHIWTENPLKTQERIIVMKSNIILAVTVHIYNCECEDYHHIYILYRDADSRYGPNEQKINLPCDHG